MNKCNRCLLISILTNILLLIIVIFGIVYYKVATKDASDIFKNNIDSIVEIKASTSNIGESFGTGVIYDKDGLVITNAHVVSYKSLGETKQFDDYKIRFTKDEVYQNASFIKMDIEKDLAILKLADDSKKYNPITFSNSKYTYGDKVYAIGNTSNYGIGISEGIISVPEVNIIYDDISRLVIQSDLNISGGNSGGALLDKKGKLIGITTFRTKDLSGNVNYGFVYSIPLKIIKQFIGE